VLNDLYRPGAAWRLHSLLQSPFHHELGEFSAWLHKAHYTLSTRRDHVIRLDCALRTMPGAAPGATYATCQLQSAFEKFRRPVSLSRMYRSTRHAYQKFLESNGRLKVEIPDHPFMELQRRYQRHIREVRGLAQGTLTGHLATVRDFLGRALRPGQELRSLTTAAIERFIALRSSEITRQTLQHTVASLRAFLRWCQNVGETPKGLCDIDSPRTYRGELLPRALDWPEVESLLRSIDLDSKSGERDYAVLHLMSHYGLRPSEVVSLRMDSIDWATNTMRVVQRKTKQDLTLPLEKSTVDILRRYLVRDRNKRHDAREYQSLFLRAKCPIGPLKNYGISGIFSKRMRENGRDSGAYSPYSLRHAFAMTLLTHGVGIKAIGDVLGHHNIESTCVYLRLDKESLRDVALELPLQTSNLLGTHHE
jgi:integrase/recombinase XerD